jgi:pimeloyl-ACP methyl ester carboxylesterase
VGWRMKPVMSRGLLCGVLLIFARGPLFAQTTGTQAAPTGTAAPPRVWGIPLSPCEAAGGREKAMCGSYEVFEDRPARSGRKLKLNLMVLQATADKPEPDPVFIIAGGPGGSAVQDEAGFGHFFRQNRDVVLLDQRGAGSSNRLACDVDDGVGAAFSRILPLDKLRHCRDELEKKADLRMYTTSVAMDDLDEVRGALGYGQINVIGGSYGTTAALDYLRRHPEHVRTITVDGVIPPSFRVPLPFPHTVQESMEGVFARCAADDKCHAAYPHLQDEFEAVLERLSKNPVTFKFTSPPSLKQPVEVTLTRDMFADFLRRILYTLPGIRLMPAAIHSAYNGDFALYARMCYEFSISSQTDIPFGMYFSILCNESFPFISDDEVARISRGSYIGDYRIRAQREMCVGWPNANVPKSFVEPVRSDKPVLLVSGELDPAAQPEYAAEAAKYLSHSKHIIVRNGSHGQSAPCIIKIVGQFLDAGSTGGLDTSCVDQIPLPAFELIDPSQVSIPAKTLAEYDGTYELRPGTNVSVTLDGGQLTLLFPGAKEGLALYPESDAKFFAIPVPFDIEFVRDTTGKITHFVFHQSGRDIRLTRK